MAELSLLPTPAAGASASVEMSAPTRVLQEVQQALVDCAGCSEPLAARQQLQAGCVELAVAVLDLGRCTPDHPLVTAAMDVIRRRLVLGVDDGMTSAPFPSVAAPSQPWLSLLARMLCHSAWRCDEAPLLGTVPQWLWPEYSSWLFAAPAIFTGEGEADRYAEHFLRHAEELAGWAERNPGSHAIQAAFASYRSAVAVRPLAASASDLKRAAGAHGRMLGAMNRGRRPGCMSGRDAGGRLRVAFVASQPGLLPLCHRLLDAERFEVSTFALEGVGEKTAGSSDPAIAAVLSLLRAEPGGRDCRQLPPSLDGQVEMLAEIGPDVVVYAEDLAFSSGGLALLAAQRIAPLQVTMAPASVTTGLAAMDLFVLGEAAFTPELAGQFSERVAVVRGSGHGFHEAPAPADLRAAARAALHLPLDACVLVTAAHLMELTAERLELWARLLRRLPTATLVIQLLQADASSAGAIEATGEAWEVLLADSGMGSERGLMVAQPIQSVGELQAVLAVGDIFLDAAAFAEPELLHAPLALGLPVVTLQGENLRTRQAAALLRTMGLEELVGTGEAQWIGIVESLAGDAVRRASLSERIRGLMDNQPLCLDPLAAAETLGQVLLCAHGEMRAMGTRQFRGAAVLRPAGLLPGEFSPRLETAAKELAAGNAAVTLAHARAVLATKPNHPEARWLAGRALTALRRYAAAVEYLVAVVPVLGNAATWFDLAIALNHNGQKREAVQALEASLRHDGAQPDAWVMLIELARAAGAHDMADQALQALRECAPLDPRISGLQGSRVG